MSEPDAPPEVHEAVLIPIDRLKPHPRNYRKHPADQIAHLRRSIREAGFYRNVIAARDLTILAGHGVVLAATEEGLDALRVVVLDLDPSDTLALKILAGDNELPKLAEVDDRALSTLLSEIRAVDVDQLIGTGFDDQMLANLVLVTRPASEIRTMDEAAAWVGMPEFPESDPGIKMVLQFETEADRDRFLKQEGIVPSKKMRQTWSGWWPAREKEDLASLRFDATPEPAAAEATGA